ncbi:MAG: TIGR01777 family protein [Bacteroidia bacterium]|nr:TIGR01777 family protein [Bacteroidia bacterium]
MDSKTIFIAGGTGFLGQALEKYFSGLGYPVRIICRSPKRPNEIAWDARTLGPWARELEGACALINLAGKSVDCRYTLAAKKAILDSRVDSTRILGQAIAACQNPPRFWLNSSTATIYQDTRGELPANTEAKGIIGNDFSMGVAKAWEQAFFEANTPQTRKLALRISIAMGREGGAFPILKKLAKRGFCSKQGPGNQWISWIHMHDFVRAVKHCLDQEMEGVVNIVAPQPILNKDFNRLLKETLKPWVVWPQPVWALEIGAWALRSQTEMILKSRKAAPERLLQSGFAFKFSHWEEALQDLLS